MGAARRTLPRPPPILVPTVPRRDALSWTLQRPPVCLTPPSQSCSMLLNVAPLVQMRNIDASRREAGHAPRRPARESGVATSGPPDSTFPIRRGGGSTQLEESRSPGGDQEGVRQNKKTWAKQCSGTGSPAGLFCPCPFHYFAYPLGLVLLGSYSHAPHSPATPPPSSLAAQVAKDGSRCHQLWRKSN